MTKEDEKYFPMPKKIIDVIKHDKRDFRVK